jgi:hypothetical protein
MRNRSALCFGFAILTISIATGALPQVSEQTPELSPEQIRAKFGKVIQQQAWTSPRVVIPNAGKGANASIIVVLRQQQEAAEAEKVQILTEAQSRKSQQQRPLSRPAGSNVQVTPGRTESSTASSSSLKNVPASSPSGIKATEVPVSTALCAPGTQPVLRAVDGQKADVVFTPDVPSRTIATSAYPYFLHTIEGCHFGDVAGHVALTGPFSKGKIDLAVDTWTDSGIVVHVPSDVTGELDQDNVTLVLTISGMALQAPGFKFYAARDEVLLSLVPSKEASLAGPQLRSNFPFYQSPGFGTFDVQRNASTSFTPGTDYYSFDGLQRGFVPVAFQASRYAPLTADQCNYMINLPGMQISFAGQWNAQWEGSRLRVDWPVARCQALKGLVPYNEWAAWYGTKIWVSGPRGIDPWPANFRLAPPPVSRQNPHGF